MLLLQVLKCLGVKNVDTFLCFTSFYGVNVLRLNSLYLIMNRKIMPDSIRAKWYQCLNEPSAAYWPSILVTGLITVVIMLNIIEVILSSMEG